MITDISAYSGLAIADYFIERCLDNGKHITNMSVLKMVYFAHGLAYPSLERKLIKNPFYRWDWGPVERHVYDTFKQYGANPIQSVSGRTNEELSRIKCDKILCQFLDSLLPLADLSPFTLSRKSHEPGGPWDVTAPYAVIDDKIIQVFFTARYAKR